MEISIEFLSREVLAPMKGDEKLKYIIGKVKDGKILVFEETLTFPERSKLMELDMSEIDENFSGIEFDTIGDRETGGGYLRELHARIIKFLGGRVGGLSVVGPANLIQEIKKDPKQIYMIAGGD